MEREQVAGFQQAYAEIFGKAKHIIVKPGDRLPVAGLDWRIVTAGGQVLKTPLPGGGKPNPGCAQFTPKDITTDPENAQSVGSVIALGQFRAIDLADLLWNKEQELMCPNNPIGTVDLYLVSHHGLDASGSPVLVHAVQPRVAVMQNGTRKGAGAQAMPTMRSSPVYIANVDDAATIASVLTAPPRGGGAGRGGMANAHSPACWIKIVAQPDGSFTVSNSRNGFSKTYAAHTHTRS